MSENKISVIIPVYNTEQYLDKCIESVVNQTYKNLEIILVDDGSTDKSGVICDKWAKEDMRIKVIHQENQGRASARNTGLKNAFGDYIGWVDSDDWIEKDMYEVLLKYAQENKSDVVSSVRIRDGQGIINQNINCQNYIGRNAYEAFLRDEICGSLCVKLYKSSIIKKIRFSGEIAEDVLANLKMFCKSKVVSQLSYRGYHYMTRESSATHSIDLLIEYKDSALKLRDCVKNDYPKLEKLANCKALGSFVCLYDKVHNEIDEGNKEYILNNIKQLLCKSSLTRSTLSQKKVMLYALKILLRNKLCGSM